MNPRNLTAQMLHRAAGNPPSTLPDAAISNSFPGLEFDFRNVWRRLFEGIEIHEAHGYVVEADAAHADLKELLLVEVAGHPTWVDVTGPTATDENAALGRASLEWSNALAEVVRDHTGELVSCAFAPSLEDRGQRTVVELRVRDIFERSGTTGDPLPVIAEQMLEPGELTQSLCSPWQNDYKECGCFYWAASRPDYVNVDATEQGTSIGNDWLARDRDPKRYDIAEDARVSYEDLFRDWQRQLRFIVGGRDYE